MKNHLAVVVLLLVLPMAVPAQTSPPAQPTAQSRKLFKAVQEGNFEIVKTIIESDVSLVAAREVDHGGTPLHYAKTVEIARYLLEKGAELEALDTAHCATPLRWAAGDRRDDVAKFLRQRGAKVDDLPLAIALAEVELVTKYLDADAKALEEPGYKCDYLGDGEHSKDPKIKGTARPLIVAINARQKTMVKLLLDRGADPTARGAYALATPLHHASFKGDPDILAILLTYDVDLEALEDTHHGTPLQWAVVSGKIPAVKLLVNAGAKVTPHITQCAKDGERGNLKGITDEKPETFRQILALLKEAKQ